MPKEAWINNFPIFINNPNIDLKIGGQGEGGPSFLLAPCNSAPVPKHKDGVKI